MCDYRVNPYDVYSGCNSGCSPCYYDCSSSCLTEYPKQKGWNAEEKFSNMIPPSFLCKGAERSCGCKPRKIVSKKCTCKAKNCGHKSDGKNDSKDDSNCPNKCKSGNTGANEKNDACANNLMCQDQGLCPVAPNCSGALFSERNEWAAIPAAGMPTKKGVSFDPCTGVECNFSPCGREPSALGHSRKQGSCGPCDQPNAMVPPQPNCIQNMCCGFPNPTTPSNFNDSPYPDYLISEDLSQNRLCQSVLRESDKKKATKKGECVCNIKWTEATPKVIERICDSLGVPNPPKNSNILLPITMSADGSDQDQSTKRPSTGSTESNRAGTTSNNETRSCGCNTVQFQNDSSESDKNVNDNNAAANKNGRGFCNAPMCCHRPQYTCCYNPYTGYYYWCRSCCCYNSCNNCNPCNVFNPCKPYCSGSCPLPKKETASKNKEGGNKVEEKTESKKNLSVSQKAKKSKSANDRTTAGCNAVLTQPTNEGLHNQFQNSILMPPLLPPQMPSPNFPGNPNSFGNIIPTYYHPGQLFPEGN